MRRWSILLLFSLFLIPLVLMPGPVTTQAISQEMDNFNYSPLYWEDWDYSGMGNYSLHWHETNSTLGSDLGNSTSNSYSWLARNFSMIPDDEDSFKIVWQFTVHNGIDSGDWYNNMYFRVKHNVAGNVREDYIYLNPRAGQARWLLYMYGYNIDDVNTGSTVVGEKTTSQIYEHFNELLTLTMEYSTETYRWDMSLENETDTLATSTSSTLMAFSPAQAERAEIVHYHPDLVEGFVNVSIFSVEAPFGRIEAIREWKGTNTGTEWYEGPYMLHQSTAGDDEKFEVKVMPFQGYKTLVNWSMVGNNGVQGGIKIKWYDRAGNGVTGYVGIFWYRDAGVYFLDFIYNDGSTHYVVQLPVGQQDAMAFCVWVDQAEETAFAYMQTDPHSSEYQDFWIVEITDIVDFDSWGVMITHESVATGTTSGEAQWQETEIFAGNKEGITQPRFGGMWWQYNILLILWVQVITWMQSVFVVALGPVISVFQSVIGTLLDYLPDLASIWGVVTSIVSDLVTEFINNFITPLVTAFFTYILPNLLLGVWLNGVAVLNSIMEALGVLLFGDANIIKNLVWGFFGTIGAFFSIIILGINVLSNTFFMLTNLALGIPVVGVDLTGPMSWINAIIYYVVNFAPIVIMFHLITAIFNTVRQQDIMPLVDAGMLYLRFAEFMFNIVREVIAMVVQGIQVIMDIIPF